MKKGIYINSVPGDDFKEKFGNAEEYGFDGVEINTLPRDKREAYKKRANDLGLEIFSVMNSTNWEKPLSDPDANVRRAGVKGVKKSIETAAAVGAETVLLVPGVVTGNVSYESVFVRSQEELKKVRDIAREKQIKVAIENVWNKFLLSPIEFKRYLEELGSRWIRAYFDVGNIALYGYPQNWIRSLSDLIDKVHVKGFDSGRTPLSSEEELDEWEEKTGFYSNRGTFTYLFEGDIDWEAVTKALRDVGYNGYVTAELPVDEDMPMERLCQTSKNLDKIIGRE